MQTDSVRPSQPTYEIGSRFRRALEERALQLETDAARDEEFAASLEDFDQFQRHLKLVEAQWAEARRLRHFLERTTVRKPV